MRLGKILLWAIPVLLCALLSPMSPQDSAAIIAAVQNLSQDPRGRVVDVTLDRPVELALPDENWRFEVDITRPLGRDIHFCAGDLNQDGISDLLGISFDGNFLFFPGLDSHPYRFGEGSLLRRPGSPAGIPFEVKIGGEWEGCAIADLDADGTPEIVAGDLVFSLLTPGNPSEVSFRMELRPVLDGFPSVGDLNGDGKPDIILTRIGRPPVAHLFLNRSTVGNLSFEETLLTDNYAQDFLGERGLSVGDLNGDGLNDLISFNGIYFNQGTAISPDFDFDSPVPYPVDEGPWINGVNSDQGISMILHDGNGDGLLDAYLSSYGTSIWQGSFYENIGSRTAPSFAFRAPLLCRSTPYSNHYRGKMEPDFSPSRTFAAAGDVNQDGLLDVLVSDGLGVFAESTVLWTRSIAPRIELSHLDIYTFFREGFPNLDPYDFFTPNWQPDVPVSWKDRNGDGLSDIIQSNVFLDEFTLSFLEGISSQPPRFAEPVPLQTESGADLEGIGWAEIDLDQDGRLDLIVGRPSSFDNPQQEGRLAVYRNLSANGVIAYADPVPLTDPSETVIDVGENAWPAAFEWDGDGQMDLLVGEQSGSIFILLNRGGHFIDGGLLSAEDWDPIRATIIGGGLISPALAPGDFDNDGLADLLFGDTQFSTLWFLRNNGSPSSPSFSIEAPSVTSTIPGRVERLSDRSFRLYFGMPVLADETLVRFYPSPQVNQASVRVVAPQERVLYLPFLREDGNSFSGYAVSNFSDEAANIRFTAYGRDGTVQPLPANPADLRIEAGTQLARVASEIFGAGAAVGWVELASDNSGIASFFQFGAGDLSRLDGSVAFADKADKLYLSRVFQGSDAFRGQPASTTVFVANPNEEPVVIALTLRPAGQNGLAARGSSTAVRNLPPKGLLEETIAELFGQDAGNGYLEVEVTQGDGVVAFELIELENTVIGLNANFGNPSSQSFSAQLASVEGLFTNVNLINTSTASRNLTLTAVGVEGEQLGSTMLTLQPGQQVSQDAGQLFPPAADPVLKSQQAALLGSLKVDSDGAGVIGDVIFGDPLAFRFAASLPLQTASFRRGVFSQVAEIEGSSFTGVAVFHPGQAAATLRIQVISSQGDLVGEFSGPLEGGKRFSSLISELIPAAKGQAGGYILIESDQPVIAQMLIGGLVSGATSFYSAVPPTVIG